MRRFCISIALTLAVCVSACTPHINTEFQQLRVDSLGPPPPGAQGWKADARLHLDNFSLLRIVRASLEDQLRQDDGFRLTPVSGLKAEITPKLTLDGLSLAPASLCSTCLELTGALGGKLLWSLGPWDGQIPVSLQIESVLSFELIPKNDALLVLGSLRNLVVQPNAALELRPGGTWRGVRIDLEKPVGRWVQKRWMQQSQSIPVGRIGGPNTPIQEARIHPSAAGLDIDLLTIAADPTPLGPPDAPIGPAAGWQLSISQESAMAILRRHVFKQGPVQRGIYVDPQALEISGSQFQLTVRLWKPGPLAWWRNFRVQGSLVLTDGKIRLSATQVEWLEHSRGAKMLDPLVTVAESHVLEAIERTFDVARPAFVESKVGKQRLRLQVREVTADENALEMSGTVRSVTAARSKRPAGDSK